MLILKSKKKGSFSLEQAGNMNILMLGWELPPHNSGGLGVACYYLTRALGIKGMSIDFLLPHRPANTYEHFKVVGTSPLVADEVLASAGAYGSFCDACDSRSCEHSLPTDMRSLQRRYIQYVERYVRKKIPDVIHAHDWLTFEAAILAKQLTSKPLIAHVHATEFDRAGHHSGNPLVHDIEYNGLLFADHIIAVSQATKNLIVERYAIPADKISVVHNSLDPQEFEISPQSENTYRYLAEMKKRGFTVVVALGRLTVQKGLTYFLEAARHVVDHNPRVLFLLAGSGELRDELIEQSARLGIAGNILFSGFVRGKAQRDAYGIADVFVMSSVSEPFGITALEAAQQGTAICISKQSGVGEVLTHVLRFDYWDTQRLADQLINLTLHAPLSTALKENVHHEIQSMSWAETADKVLRIYSRYETTAQLGAVV